MFVNHNLLTLPASKVKKILKLFLLGHLHQLLCELIQQEMMFDGTHVLEHYAMDSKIIQHLIQGIVETGDYTLEGIAYHTHIPLDIIYDAAYGVHRDLSITPWAKIIDLYMQVKPEVAAILVEKLLEMKEKDGAAFSLLLSEK